MLASLTLSVISLFVAIGGAATAGKNTLPVNSVGTKQLKDGAVTLPDVAPRAIGPQALATGSVTSTALAPNAVTPPALAPNAVGPGKISDNSITGPKIAPGAVTTTSLAGGAVTGPKIGPRAVSSGALATGSVTSTALAPNAVTPPAIATGAVGPGKISDNSITGPKIAPGAVTSTSLAGGAVTAPKIGPKAVSTPALSIPELTVQTTGQVPNQDMGDCQGFDDHLSFTAVRANPSSMFSASAPKDLVAPVDGVYSLSFSWNWSHSDGTIRGAGISLARGDTLDLVGLPAVAPGPAGYPQTFDVGSMELQAGDALRISPLACGGLTPETAPTLNSFNVTMKWVAQPAS